MKWRQFPAMESGPNAPNQSRDGAPGTLAGLGRRSKTTLPSAAAGRAECSAEDCASRGRSSESRRQTRWAFCEREARVVWSSRVSGEVVTPTVRAKRAFERARRVTWNREIRTSRRVATRAL
jgi:hypothetical protein